MKVKKHITIDSELYDKIQKLAKKDNRGISNQIETLLNYAFFYKESHTRDKEF